MKLVKILLALVGGLLALLFAGSYALPSDYRVERSLLVAAPAEKVFAHLDSSQGWARWGVWYRKDPQMVLTPGAVTQGLGASWSWTSRSQGNGGMTLTAVEPNRRVAYNLQFDDFDPSTGAIELRPEAGGTRVVWTMQGHLSGPLARWFGFFMERLVGPDFDAGLTNLKTLAETP